MCLENSLNTGSVGKERMAGRHRHHTNMVSPPSACPCLSPTHCLPRSKSLSGGREMPGRATMLPAEGEGCGGGQVQVRSSTGPGRQQQQQAAEEHRGPFQSLPSSTLSHALSVCLTPAMSHACLQQAGSENPIAACCLSSPVSSVWEKMPFVLFV